MVQKGFDLSDVVVRSPANMRQFENHSLCLFSMSASGLPSSLEASVPSPLEPCFLPGRQAVLMDSRLKPFALSCLESPDTTLWNKGSSRNGKGRKSPEVSDPGL